MSFVKASEIKEGSELRGFSPLDELIGGLRGESSYLMFGDLAELAMYFYVVEAASSGPVLYVNATDYYSERKIIDQDLIGFIAKSKCLEFSSIAKNITEVSVHSPQRLLEARRHFKEGYRLYVYHGLDSFISSPEETNSAFHAMLKASVASGAPLIALTKGEGEPESTSLVRSLSNYIISLRRSQGGVEVEVLKPFRSKKTFEVGWMGRLTRSFRERFEEYLKALDEELLPLLRGDDREAYEELKRLWSSETASMSALDVATVYDAMVFMALIKVYSEVLKLKKEAERKKE